MSSRTKLFVGLMVASIATMIALAIVGNVLEQRHALDDPALAKRVGYAAGAVFFALFLLMGFSLVPLFLRAFIVLQTQIGNGELGIVRGLRAHERGITWAVWAFFLLGLGIAAPVMLHDLFGVDFRPGVGDSEGVLVARIGMTLDEVRARSSLKLVDPVVSKLLGESYVIGSPVFDFEIAGTGVRFERCRYYWIETGEHGDLHVASMNIGVSTNKVSRAELVAENERVARLLAADGWQAGQFVYRTEEERTLHGGALSSGRGAYWKKDGTLLRVLGKRMDDEQPGEDPATAGEWIQYLELGSPDASIYADLEWDPPQR